MLAMTEITVIDVYRLLQVWFVIWLVLEAWKMVKK